MIDKKPCLIWNTPALAFYKYRDSDLISKWKSPRVRGEYAHSVDVEDQIKELEDRDKVKLTSWLIEQRKFGNQIPTITGEVISMVKQRKISVVNERTDKILKYLEAISPSAGRKFSIQWLFDFGYELDPTLMDKSYAIYFDLLCQSESADSTELGFLFDYLQRSGYLEEIQKHREEIFFKFTVEGYQAFGSNIAKKF